MTGAVPYPEYLAELVDRLRAVAGERLVGAWLVGSAALGDFDPARSDLDVQAVTAERLSRVERRLIVETASHEALPCPVRGLELVLYAREELMVPAYELNLNTGPRMERRVSYDAGEEPRFWFVLDLAISREHGIPLAGPPSRDVIPELPRATVLEALREALTWYAGEGGDEAQTVLAACRAWAWASDGVWRSKGEAADWARGRMADPDPVDRALAHRDDPAAPPPSAREREALVSCALAAA